MHRCMLASARDSDGVTSVQVFAFCVLCTESYFGSGQVFFWDKHLFLPTQLLIKVTTIPFFTPDLQSSFGIYI